MPNAFAQSIALSPDPRCRSFIHLHLHLHLRTPCSFVLWYVGGWF
jgi:hypothetical protein